MAGNKLIEIFRIRDLRQRIIYTLMMLIIFRLGAVLPIPGIDVNAVQDYFSSASGGRSGLGFVDYLDFFAGGAFKNFSIFMLGIMPYISMSIIMQLLLIVFPSLKKMAEEDGGRKKVQRLTRYGTVIVALVQSVVVSRYAEGANVIIPGLEGVPFLLISMMTVTCGTLFLMWMGEQINQRGIGNGISLIIFAGIVARMPSGIYTLIGKVQDGDINPVILLLVLSMFVGIIALVIYEQQGQRKIPVHYAKRVVGRKMYGAQNTYIPFKINPSGVIPVIFASSVMSVPIQVLQSLGGSSDIAATISRLLDPLGLWYNLLYVILIIFFAYFYTQVTLNPQEISKQIKENGGTIPGIRSDRIEEYLTRILNRIVLPGSLFLGLIAIIPNIVQIIFEFPPAVAYLMGGTSLLIMVGVDLDTMSQIEGHLRMHHHDGLLKKGRIKSRNL